MIDLHTHSTFSDGELIPAELARRAAVAGYRALAITDHIDLSNMYHTIENVRRLTDKYSPYMGIDLFAGCEVTHVPPGLIPDTIVEARRAGAQIVVVHGETIVEPVERGTNLAAIEGGCDILAHPGLITPQEMELAAEKNVYVEITTRKGHSLTNGRVAAMARQFGTRLVIDNDAHAPGDLISAALRKAVALGAGLSEEEYLQAEANSRALVEAMVARL
ncbi:MAG: histidinol phosphate phosphatase domain-containing protein [Desulfovibrio sp.]|uniref:histidinol phosphate phosphatase domain-containing protein n=1 Tax=Desulfovibrio sp. 7SRBS1 TaxID=3378064 RepID=UPI003B41B50F